MTRNDNEYIKRLLLLSTPQAVSRLSEVGGAGFLLEINKLYSVLRDNQSMSMVAIEAMDSCELGNFIVSFQYLGIAGRQETGQLFNASTMPALIKHQQLNYFL